MHVELTVTGVPRELPHHLELCAYRVVQEAVTNAVRHAPHSSVRIHLDHRRDCLEIRVDSDLAHAVAAPGTGSSAAAAGTAVTTGAQADAATDGLAVRPAGTGLGLTGMRERVAATGGDLTAGPAGRGWVVHARIPTPAPGDPAP
jgi:signal transduction histidine kinase